MKRSRSDTEFINDIRSLTSLSLTAMPTLKHSQRLPPRHRNGGSKPRISHAKAIALALVARDAMPSCRLDDDAVTFLAIRANTLEPTTRIAKALGMDVRRCYMLMAAPQAQELLQHLARGTLGAAALMGVATMTKLMGSKDPHIAYRAADAMMERAGLGVSNRSTQGGTTAFAFSFSGSRPGATDGTHQRHSDAGGAVKNGGSASGEAHSPTKLLGPEDKGPSLPEDYEVQPPVLRGDVASEEREPSSVRLRPLKR
jgi:hypothetical protein